MLGPMLLLTSVRARLSWSMQGCQSREWGPGWGLGTPGEVQVGTPPFVCGCTCATRAMLGLDMHCQVGHNAHMWAAFMQSSRQSSVQKAWCQACVPICKPATMIPAVPCLKLR